VVNGEQEALPWATELAARRSPKIVSASRRRRSTYGSSQFRASPVASGTSTRSKLACPRSDVDAALRATAGGRLLLALREGAVVAIARPIVRGVIAFLRDATADLRRPRQMIRVRIRDARSLPEAQAVSTVAPCDGERGTGRAGVRVQQGPGLPDAAGR
jgi:hypothetical protein